MRRESNFNKGKTKITQELQKEKKALLLLPWKRDFNLPENEQVVSVFQGEHWIRYNDRIKKRWKDPDKTQFDNKVFFPFFLQFSVLLQWNIENKVRMGVKAIFKNIFQFILLQTTVIALYKSLSLFSTVLYDKGS